MPRKFASRFCRSVPSPSAPKPPEPRPIPPSPPQPQPPAKDDQQVVKKFEVPKKIGGFEKAAGSRRARRPRHFYGRCRTQEGGQRAILLLFREQWPRRGANSVFPMAMSAAPASGQNQPRSSLHASQRCSLSAARGICRERHHLRQWSIRRNDLRGSEPRGRTRTASPSISSASTNEHCGWNG